MRKELTARPDGHGLRVAVVVAAFNEEITTGLRDGAVEFLTEAGVEHITEVTVPGALELPIVAARLAVDHDAVVAIGAVIQGETDHYEHVATQASAGLMQVGLARGVPIGNALITVRELEHAVARSRPGPHNKGAEAAAAALQTVHVLREIDDLPGG